MDLKINTDNYNAQQKEFLSKIKIDLNLKLKDLPELHDQYIYNKIYESAAPLLESGYHVSVDAVFDHEGMSYFKHSFKNTKNIYWVLRYSTFEKNIKQCIERNGNAFKNNTMEFRDPMKVLYNFFDLYKLKTKSKICESNIVLEKFNFRTFSNSLNLLSENSKKFANSIFPKSSNQISHYMINSEKKK